MTTSHILEVVLATLAQFMVGGMWYTPLFGKVWAQIHCFDKLDPKTQKEMQSKMAPLLGIQLLVTLVTTIVLSVLIPLLPTYSPYVLTSLLWLGFVVPTQVSAVLFGGTEPQWVWKKIAIMAGGSLACLLVAAFIINLV